jgi:hypothetical protein
LRYWKVVVVWKSFPSYNRPGYKTVFGLATVNPVDPFDGTAAPLINFTPRDRELVTAVVALVIESTTCVGTDVP